MNLFLTFAFLFFIGSTGGWVAEVLFRRFLSTANPERKWINPGFLAGPCVPLYGFGLCLLYLLAGLDHLLAPLPAPLFPLLLFLVMAAVMTLLEYVAGLIFVRGMKVKLWDYSARRGNVQGIICPLFSGIWGLLGLAYYYLVHPYILNALRWLSENLAFSFFIGFFFGVFVLDFCYSAHILAKVRKFAADNQIVVIYDELKASIRRTLEERREKAKFLFAFSSRSEVSFTDSLRRYADKVKTLARDRIPFNK